MRGINAEGAERNEKSPRSPAGEFRNSLLHGAKSVV
jgi:hypothetical protein